MDVIGVILAGGSGTRLWPLSRKLVPKQLLNLSGQNTLLQETCERIKPIIKSNQQWIITNNDLFHQVKKQIFKVEDNISKNQANTTILLEPEAKNTAPAILWAAFRCKKIYGEDSIMVVLPSDHLISKEENFLETLDKGIEKAKEGNLLTFGIFPVYAETGFGYVKTIDPLCSNREIYAVEKFVEKPNKEAALKFINEGRYLWNSGIFVFHVKALLDEAKKYCVEIYNAFNKIDPDDKKSIKHAFRNINAISIDYAIMEHTKKAFVIQADIGWSDVGNWKSLYEASNKDRDGNVINGDNIAIDTTNCYIYSKDRLVVTLGLSNIAVVDTADALLVAPLEQTGRIREVIDQLKEKKSKTHIEHVVVDRPWGDYKILQIGPGYKIKRIRIEPGESISLQYHKYRSEHWIVVRGTVKVIRGDETIFVHENESTFIPIGMVHSLENLGIVTVEIIETQCGSYLEEDDIIRLYKLR